MLRVAINAELRGAGLENTTALDLATELKNTAFCPASLSSAGLGSVFGRAWDTSDVTAFK
jgi:hypothetical protein